MGDRHSTMTGPEAGHSLVLLSDEEAFLETASATLARAGFDVTALVSPWAVLELLEDACFDVAVVDCDIQGMDAGRFFSIVSCEHPLMAIIALATRGLLPPSGESGNAGLEVFIKPCDVKRVGQAARAAVRRAGMPASPSPRSSVVPVRLLLVHDRAESASKLGRVLSRRGMVVETATGGAQAGDALREGEFDVAVIDGQDPGIRELEIVRRAGVPATAVVILARSTPACIVPWQDAYCVHCAVAGPSDVEDLVWAIREAAASARGPQGGGDDGDPGRPGESMN